MSPGPLSAAERPLPTCYHHPATRAASRTPADPQAQRGLFATAPLRQGELLVVFTGALYTWDDFRRLPERERSLSIQIEAELLLVPRPPCDADYLNHSCLPNAGLAGQVAVVALRDIRAGEEVCYDYAMSDTLPYDDFTCRCGAPQCRGRVTSEDWRRPELQRRYAGFFAPHVQRLIAAADRGAAQPLVAQCDAELQVIASAAPSIHRKPR